MKKRAFTLAEMMVYMAVLSVFTTALYSVFGLSGRFYRVSEARSDSLQAALTAASSVNRLLAGGANTTLQINSGTAPPTSDDPVNTPAMLFLSSQPVDGSNSFHIDTASGDLRWQKWVCIYLDRANQRLMTTSQELPTLNSADLKPTTIPASPTFTIMINGPLVPGLRRRLIARGISEMKLSLLDTRTVSYSISTGFRPAVTTSGAQPASVGVTTTGYFTLRN